MRSIIAIGCVLALGVGAAACGSSTQNTSGDYACTGSWTVGGASIKQIAVGPDGRVWAADQNGDRVLAFDAAGDEDLRLTEYFNGNDVASPQGVAVTSDGDVFVSDYTLIYHLDADGGYIDDLSVALSPGYLQAFPDGQLLVVDQGTITRFDRDGQVLDELDPGFYLLHFVAAAQDGSFYALDEPEDVEEDLVAHFDQDGEQLGEEWSLGMFGSGLAVGPNGNVYAGGWMGFPRMLGVYSPQGDLLAEFNTGVDNTCYLTYVLDVAVGADGEVYLAGIAGDDHAIVHLSPND